MRTLVYRCFRPVAVLLLLFFSFLSIAKEPVFQFVRSIGDERENYFFIQIGGIAFSDKKDIFVLDRTTFSIIKYDWNGVFISRAGQRGRGPGDFATPSGIQCFGDKIYVDDWLNRRIAVTDLNLKDFDYIKTHNLKDPDQRNYSPLGPPILLKENQFLAVNREYSPEKGSLFIFDKNQKVIKYFFCDLPTDLRDELWRLKGGEEKRFLFDFLTHPIVGVNHQKKEFFVSFIHPGNDIRFYLYNFSGELIRKSSYRQDKKFQFPIQQLDSLVNPPRNTSALLNILPYKDYYIVFMVESLNRMAPDLKTNFYYLFVDKQGEVKHKIESKIRFIAATPDGYLGGILFDKEQDLLKLVIYKLNLD